MEKKLLINGYMVDAVYDDAVVRNLFEPLLQMLVERQRKKQGRLIVFLAAPPGTGKSTLTAFLQEYARTLPGMPRVQELGMDGFHYHQEYIAAHTVLRDGVELPMQRVKGAPESFDLKKFQAALERLRHEDILWPVYDRRLHDVVEDAVRATAPIVLVEGNYLLLDRDGWRDLPHDYAIFIEAQEGQLRERLITRKMRSGATYEQALAHFEACDGPNVRLCLEKRLSADLVLRMTGDGTYEKDVGEGGF